LICLSTEKAFRFEEHFQPNRHKRELHGGHRSGNTNPKKASEISNPIEGFETTSKFHMTSSEGLLFGRIKINRPFNLLYFFKRFEHLNIRILYLFRISIFGFRIF